MSQDRTLAEVILGQFRAAHQASQPADIDDAGQHRLSGCIDHHHALGCWDRAGWADGGNATLADQNVRVGLGLASGTVDQQGIPDERGGLSMEGQAVQAKRYNCQPTNTLQVPPEVRAAVRRLA